MDSSPQSTSPLVSSELSMDFLEFSVTRKYGIKLHIDEPLVSFTGPLAFDVETDEKDNFVGIALCAQPDEVWYYTQLTKDVIHDLETIKLIGHNVKSDLKWLKQWGADIPSENVHMDTMIMSYVLNPTSESHGLKQIGKEFLALEWPKYRDIVGKGKKKITLDKQSVDVVANYCGMDAVATFRLYNYFMRRLSPTQMKLLYNLEMPVCRLLIRMEQHGLTLDVPMVGELDAKFTAQIKEAEDKLQHISDSVCAPVDKPRDKFNPRSPKQVVDLANALSIQVTSSNKKALLPFKSHPFVSTLFVHRAISKLHSGYIKRFKNCPTLPKVYPVFSQVSVDEATDEWKGIRTGRLSSDYHNIPRRSEEGSLLRKLFVAPSGKQIICGDYSQIEYRLLAHFTKEPLLLEAFRKGDDPHATVAKNLFGSDNRDFGKTFNFAAIYGAHAKKVVFIAERAKITLTEEQAEAHLRTYWQSLKRVTSWINRVKFEARSKRGVRTISGRWIPIPDILSANSFDRYHAERQAVNYIIQGSAADIIKMAMLECDKAGYFPILQVHDELLFESEKDRSAASCAEIKSIVEHVIKLEVPLEADFGIGSTWDEAKG